jgi:sugar diacid utilization regulator
MCTAVIKESTRNETVEVTAMLLLEEQIFMEQRQWGRRYST